MAIKIVSHYNKYKITLSDGISRGYSIFANNKEEVINAVKHYLVMKHNRKKCPSCRDRR